ncbi:hypothetical protein GQ457_10G014080 [Hibiscus cannabinus]
MTMYGDGQRIPRGKEAIVFSQAHNHSSQPTCYRSTWTKIYYEPWHSSGIPYTIALHSIKKTWTIEEYDALLRPRKVQEFEIYVNEAQPKNYMEKLVTLTGTSKQWVEAQFRGKGGSDAIAWDRLRGWIHSHPDSRKEVPLLGLWGATGYAPLLVSRKYGSRQFVPATRGLGLCEFVFEGDKTKKKILEIANAWLYPYQAKLAAPKLNPDYQIWRTKRKNCKIPSPSCGKALTLKEQFKVVPTEVEIVQQECQSDMFENELNHVNVDFKDLLDDSLQQHKDLIDELQDSMKMNNGNWDLQLQFARGDIKINHPHYTRFKAKMMKERLQNMEKFQEQVTQDMKNLRDTLKKEVLVEDSSSLPRKSQETCPRFVFSAGGLHSNVQNPTNLHDVSDSNLWASPIKTEVPNFNDPIKMEKLKEEQSRDFGATDDKFKYLEEGIKAMEGTDAFIGTNAMELSLVPDLILPPSFKVPEFKKFDCTSCPNAHLTMLCRKMKGYKNDDKLLIHCFQDSLTGSVMRWYNQLSRAQVSTWRELARAFEEQYKHVLVMVHDLLTLQNIGKNDKESFCEYAQRWRDIAAQVQPSLFEKETTTLFINSLESTPMYYAKLVGSTTRDFADLVTAGEAIERAIKSAKLNDPEASKKTHSKRRETEINMVGSGRRSYTNYQPSPQIIYPTTYLKPIADPLRQQTQSQGEPKSLKANKEKQTLHISQFPTKIFLPIYRKSD